MLSHMDEIAEYCYGKIVAQAKRPIFVGVIGDSGSGKSLLANLLASVFKSNNQRFFLINHDDFLISRSDRIPMKSVYYEHGRFKGYSHWEVLENMFRLNEFKQVISDLKEGKQTSYYPYDRRTGTVSRNEIIVHPMDFMIFDTSMMINEMDFTIMIEVSQENIINRKIQRDSDIRMADEVRDMHQKVQGFYWTDRGRPDKADITIDNNDMSSPRII